MRRQDKLKNIEKLNRRLNENRFSWDGTYANEVNEDEYSYPYDAEETTDSEDITDPYELKETETVDEIVVGLGDDIEIVDEDCGCPLNQPEPTDVKKSQWFSDVDGERITDKQVD